jgi:hypothetical protein
MKLKRTLARPLAKAVRGESLNEQDRKVLAALARWILQGSPDRQRGVWADDDTVPNLGAS